MTDPNTLDQAAEALDKAAETAPEDQAREHLIKAHGLRMEAAEARANAGDGCYFTHKADARWHLTEMQTLIGKRPADFVGQLPVLRRVPDALLQA